MATKNPLARVKEEFGGKDKLVDKIVGLLGSEDDESKDDKRRRLLGAANSKLLRLHRIASSVKDAGGKEQLAGAVATDLGHGKDKDFVTKLGSYSPGRLIDIRDSARRRAARAKAKATAAAAPKAKRTVKAPPATKAAAKATAAKATAKAGTKKTTSKKSKAAK